ncbi:MAG: hypothetical protein K9M17_06880 [Mariprofundaceae bacterium]|nr:hypothetical protein [Mariprofundaceae bacterium]
MKLVFQIAGGIVLAALIVWGVQVAVVTYVAKQAVEQMQTTIKQQQQHQSRMQQERARQKALQEQKKAQRLAREKVARAEQQRQQRLVSQEQARLKAAFDKWWQPPQWCTQASSIKKVIQCGDLKRLKRAEFDQLLASGKVTLPPRQVRWE